jgi:hypothetical protein
MKHQERKTTSKRIAKLTLFLLWLMPVSAVAQTPAITATSSQGNIQPNEIFTITLSVDTAVDAYYFGIEAVFDPDVFEFVSESAAGLMSSGISVADLLSEDRVGASVSRTSPLESPDSGDLLVLTFRAKQTAPVGLSQITFENVELNDSEGALIETSDPSAQQLSIEEAISDLQLAIPADNNITEGDELQVTGSIYVNDVTVDENTESARVTVWVGVNTVDSDPSGWDETAWTKMEFDAAQNSYHQYVDSVGFGMDTGNYYIALRAQLDSESYVYGGRSDSGGGFWDGIDNVNAGLIIAEQPLYRHILAGWNFDDETLVASKAVPDNDGVVIQLVGADEDGFRSGASGKAANSDGWKFTEGDEKYWLTELSTEGFQNITVASKQYGTSSGPRDFELEASLDGVDWEVVSPDTIRLASDWSSGVIDDIALPANYENRQNIYLRWIRRGDFRVDGDEGITVGNNRIDDAFIRGENMNVQDVDVWPGDCDQSGIVDELDVFRIGQYWQTEGPTPVYNSTAWAKREVESWIPEEAAFADANGDGVVNHKDLQPLGLHFGKDNTSTKHTAHQKEPVAEMVLPALKTGERAVVAVKADESVDLTGLSVRFRIEGVDASGWNIKEVTAADWGSKWIEDNKLLTFKRKENGTKDASATWIYKGKGTPEKTDSLAVILVEAVYDWEQQTSLVLERLIVAENRKQKELETAVLVSEDAISSGPAEPKPDLPVKLRLNQNYPNPFNPSTVISYALPKDGEVSIILYDMLGRKVATIFEGVQEAGTHDIRYEPVSLSSGIYIYQLKTKEKILSRKLTFVK